MSRGDLSRSELATASEFVKLPEVPRAPQFAGRSAGDRQGGLIGHRLAAGILEAAGPGEALTAWAAFRIAGGERLSRRGIVDRLALDVASLDAMLGRQLDRVLHHPRFQQIESTWRSLFWLVDQAEAAGGGAGADGRSPIEVRVLPVTKRELARDFATHVEFDRSEMWRKIYEQEFGMPGGTPYGLLVADYAFGKSPDDLELLFRLTEVAAAAFAPLIAAPQPDLLGVDSLCDLEEVPPLESLHAGAEYVGWRSLRAREESRFLGLALPRVLARLPYDGLIGPPASTPQPEQSWARRGFRYREQVDGRNGGSRLWTSAAWAFAGVVMAEFGRSGWFADIRGGSRGTAGGGLVEGLPVESFGSSEPFASRRGPVETTITEIAESRLSEAGFVPLVATGADGRAVFYSNQSVNAPAVFDRAEATANARLSTMLQYMLCVSRFAHYLKVIARDKIGTAAGAENLEEILNDWVQTYVTPDDRASPETRARLPLRAASVEITDEPHSPGAFRVVMRLQPHFQLDQLATSVRLTTSVRKYSG